MVTGQGQARRFFASGARAAAKDDRHREGDTLWMWALVAVGLVALAAAVEWSLQV